MGRKDRLLPRCILLFTLLASQAPAQEPPDKDVARLIAALSAEDESVRAEAALALGRFRAKGAIPALVGALGDRHPRVAFHASTALGQIGAPATPALIRALKHRDVTIRRLSIRALGRMKREGETAYTALVELLQDSDFDVRAEAASAVVEVAEDPARAAEPLTPLLEDRHPRVRLAACRSLVQTGKAALSAEATLLKLRRDPDAAVRREAVRAIRILEVVTPVPGVVGGRRAPPDESRSTDWPQWRGPNRDNRSFETGLLKEWPKEGPPRAWSVEGIGEGIAAPAVAGGRVYVVGYLGDGEYLTALDARTGEAVWRTKIGKVVRENSLMRWLGQRMPTVDEKLVFAFSGDATLSAIDVHRGRILWRVAYQRLGAPRHRWHPCDYPLVDGKLLIIAPGGTASVVALNKANGRPVWKSIGLTAKPAHAALVPMWSGRVRQYMGILDNLVFGVLAKNGRPLWRFEGAGRMANSATPILYGDSVLIPGGYGAGLLRLDVRLQRNRIDVKEVYRRRIYFSAFQDSSLIHDGRLYVVGGSKGLQVLDPASGEVMHSAPALGKGNAAMTYADDRLYVRDTSGTVVLVEPTERELLERGRFSIPPLKRTIGSSNPVVAAGKLYLRDESRLLAFDLKEGKKLKPSLNPPIVLSIPATPAPPGAPARPPVKRSHAVFIATPQDVVHRMLQAAGVRSTDTVYDLGSGDGRIVLAAAERYRAKGVGIEIEEALVKRSRQSAAERSLGHLVRIKHGDLFQMGFADASVVACYLPEDLLHRLVPRFGKLKRGSRIVSHQFRIPGYEPDRTESIRSSQDFEEHRIHVYSLPLKPSTKPGQQVYECRNCGAPVAGWPGCVTNCRMCRRSFVYGERAGE